MTVSLFPDFKTDNLLPIPEAARELGLTRNQVYVYMRDFKMKPLKLGGHAYLRLEDVNSLKEWRGAK